MTMKPDLAAGDFAVWATEMKAAIVSRQPVDVPCGPCNVCCKSSQFIHIEPDEKDALAHIDKALLFPAPGLPRGNKLLGYDERGHCPLLVDERCTIYAHRPRTCRTYDCRIFPAASLVPDQPQVGQHVRRWRFSFGAGGQDQKRAVAAAAAFLRQHTAELPSVPANPTQLAVLSLLVHGLFLDEKEPTLEALSTEIKRHTTRRPEPAAV